jgi:hypothetical protein
VNETRTPTAGTPPVKVYERCEQCSAPVDEGQRHCVVCGSRNKRAGDPVARYLAVATSRSRAANSSRPPGAGRRRPAGLGTAAVIAVIPLAVAVGVIAGRTGSGGDAQLIAALKAQKPPVVTVTGGAAAASSGPAVTTSPVTSTFLLTQGYAVELETLPAGTATHAAITEAERAAGAKGATAVGVIAGHDFAITPKPAVGVDILYSGEYKTRGAATAALAKLKRRFPGALVIAVHPISGAASASTGGQVNATATKTQLAQGSQAVKKISHATGSGYVEAQNNLPGVVSVP